MTKHRTALILQAMILSGLLLAAVISAPTRAAATGASSADTVVGQADTAAFPADYVRVTSRARG